jgi:type I restriction enzyme M protein
VQLINAAGMFKKMSKSLGNKRNEISPEQIAEITQIYGDFTEGKYCKIFDNEDFGYSRITVERPQLDEEGNVVTDRKGNPKADSSLRDYENVPLKEDVEEYFNREVLPHVPDAWIEHSKTKIGYEVNFTRYFYEYTPLRSTSEIRDDILKLKEEIAGLTLKAID